MLKSVRGRFLPRSLGVFEILFLGSLTLYLVILIVENLIEGAVSNTLSPNYFLAIVFITGVLGVFAPQFRQIKGEPVTKLDYYLISTLAIVGAVLVHIKMHEMGGLAWAVSIGAGLLILMIGFLLLKTESEKTT